jgi:hypothetical protein
MRRGSTMRVLAGLAALAAAGLVVGALVERREIEGRYWLWRLGRAENPVEASHALRRAWALLGPGHPLLARALAVEPGDIEVAFEVPGEVAVSEHVTPRGAVTNRSARPLVLLAQPEVLGLRFGDEEAPGGLHIWQGADLFASPLVLGPGASRPLAVASSFSGAIEGRFGAHLALLVLNAHAVASGPTLPWSQGPGGLPAIPQDAERFGETLLTIRVAARPPTATAEAQK